MEHRTYARALRDAYWPLVNGTFDPTFAWYLTTSLMIIFATASLAVSKNKKKQTPEELANDIENFAERFHFNASTAKEILKIAPEVVEHLPDEIRVYFDMIKNGDFSLKDKKFLDIIANTLAHYLQTHPEDMKIIMSAIGYTGLPKDARALYKTLMNGNAK